MEKELQVICYLEELNDICVLLLCKDINRDSHKTILPPSLQQASQLLKNVLKLLFFCFYLRMCLGSSLGLLSDLDHLQNDQHTLLWHVDLLDSQ